MKTADLRNLSEAELQKQLEELQQTLFNMRFQQSSGQLPDTNKLTQTRHQIARLKTLLREQELAVQRGVRRSKGGT